MSIQPTVSVYCNHPLLPFLLSLLSRSIIFSLSIDIVDDLGNRSIYMSQLQLYYTVAFLVYFRYNSDCGEPNFKFFILLYSLHFVLLPQKISAQWLIASLR
jgi:hypothetical protein